MPIVSSMNDDILHDKKHSIDSMSLTIDEFTKKCDSLINEYNALNARNKELKELIEKQSKIKKILMNPSTFNVEIRKAQLEIQTYIDSLNEIERLSKMTLEKINHT